MKKRIASFFMALCFVIVMLPTTVLAVGEHGISVSATEVKNGDTFTVTLTIPAISEPLSNLDLQISFDSSAFEVIEYTKPAFAGMSNTTGEANAVGKITCMHESETGDNDLTGLQSGGTMTATFRVKETAESGSYNFEVIEYVLDSIDENTYESVNRAPAGAVKTATVNVISATDPYTANISANDTEFTVDDEVAVTVNVGGAIGSFASAEITLTYDPDYLTLKENHTLNGASMTVNNGTIKLVDDLPHHYDVGEKDHWIDITEGSFVQDVFGAPAAVVNSYHSWEIGRLAPELEVAARSRDGVIEAVECRERNVFATQWHPEQSFHTGDPLEHKFIENFLNNLFLQGFILVQQF